MLLEANQNSCWLFAIDAKKHFDIISTLYSWELKILNLTILVKFIQGIDADQILT